MNIPILARKIRIETPMRCDFDGKPMKVGTYATQIVGDETVPAQGMYHGPRCYHAACQHMEELKAKTN